MNHKFKRDDKVINKKNNEEMRVNEYTPKGKVVCCFITGETRGDKLRLKYNKEKFNEDDLELIERNYD